MGCNFPTSRLRSVDERFQVVDGKRAGKGHGSVVTFVNVFVSWQRGCWVKEDQRYLRKKFMEKK